LVKKNNKTKLSNIDLTSKLSKAVLNLLKTKSWSEISVKSICKKSSINRIEAYSIFKEKKDILLIINNFFDQQMLSNMDMIEKTNKRDQIFEILMIRFDILNQYRISIIKLYKYIIKKPDLILFLFPSLIKSMNIILETSKISSDGVFGNLKADILLLVYLATLLVWLKDENKDLEKTMVALDSNLSKIDYIKKLIK